jgi:hypothetical protein
MREAFANIFAIALALATLNNCDAGAVLLRVLRYLDVQLIGRASGKEKTKILKV